MEKYYIGARSQQEAERIALEHGLNRNQWRCAHGGVPHSNLRDGIRVSDRKYLIGEFTSREWFVLTAHLPRDKSYG